MKKPHSNAKPINGFKSGLEKTCADMLIAAGLDFQYEPISITLIPDFTHAFESWEPVKYKGVKHFSANRKKVQAITYTPDFVGDDWIIETKGRRTEDFNLRWKLFKALIINNDLPYNLFLPGTVKQIAASIERIKELKLIKNQTNVNIQDKKPKGRRSKDR